MKMARKKSAKTPKKKELYIQLPYVGKIHPFSILKITGIILHVPAIMVFLSTIICLIFDEDYAFFPLLYCSIIIFFIAQLLYRIFTHDSPHNLGEAMLGAVFGWVICSLVGALPYWCIAHKLGDMQMSNESIHVFTYFINSVFESFSGFTSTGLTMISLPSKLPHILQWWRTFQCWIGGMGLVVFIISLIEPKKEEYRLYLAEANTEYVGKNIRLTIQKTWYIYLLYTFFIFIFFCLSKMPVWDSLNHAMSSISTGGFHISDDSMHSYSFSAQIIALLGMTLGAMSFSLHYHIVTQAKFSCIWKSMQHRLLFIFLIVGSGIIILANYVPTRIFSSVFPSVFSWFTALTTCGFSISDMNMFSAAVKLLLIFAMIIGAASGSTCGGVKIRRIKDLFSVVILRLKGMTRERERKTIEKIEKSIGEQAVVDIEIQKSEKASKLYSSTILFLLWIICVVLGWFFIMLFIPTASPMNAFFDVGSALGNVGLSTGVVHPAMSSGAKGVFIFLMLLGRLEIIPIIILISTFFTWISRKSLRLNKKSK